MTATLLFETGAPDGGFAFVDPVAEIRADTPDEVGVAFAAMSEARDAGKWIAGYASYELGYALIDRLMPLMPAQRDVPLMHFAVFDAPTPAAPILAAAADQIAGVRLSRPEPQWSEGEYAAAFARLRDYIGAGDVYQVNLTFPFGAQATGTALGLWQALQARQPVRHGAFVDLGGTVLLSRSPELFFRVDKAGHIITRPMKGTLPRGATPAEDDARADWLAHDPKNRAENLMIVDLLRNDVSRLSRTGSVRVPELFKVERYRTVLQMTSTVEARLRDDIGLRDIFEALFPCGSITGAPKIRAMEIIRELEATPRGAYCGAIGWIAPDGAMEFNVAIRTLALQPDGAVRFNAGGGVVWDSTADAEYEEVLWKTRFAHL